MTIESVKDKEVVTASKTLFLPDIIANKFSRRLSEKGFKLHKLTLFEKNTSEEKDGTFVTVVKPITLTETDTIDHQDKNVHGLYLLKGKYGVDYLVELKTVSRRHDYDQIPDYVIGISQLPSIDLEANYGEVNKDILKKKVEVETLRGVRGPHSRLPSLVVDFDYWGLDVTVSLLGNDINLEEFYKELTS